MSACATCGGWVWTDRHTCPPIYKVRCPETTDEGDYWEVRAIDAEEAAEKWAERDDSDSAEYMIVGGHSTPTVEVKAPDGTITRWTVSGEAVPRYSAREIAASEPQQGEG